MKHTIHTRTAALALLLPMSLAAFPAAAQEHWRREAQPQTQVRVQSVTVNADRGLEPGSTLYLQMSATPRARRAEVTLGDSGIVVRLREEAPGVYTGSYTVSRNDRIDPRGKLLAGAVYGEREVAGSFSYPPAFQALAQEQGRDRGDRGEARDARDGRDGRDRGNDRDRGRDSRGPVVEAVSPAEGARVQEHPMRLVARFSDAGSGVDPASVQLRIDGRDVTPAARVSPQELVITGELPRGRHTAELSLRDRAGNSSTRSWSFEVVDAPRVQPVPPPAPVVRAAPAVPLVLQVTNLTENAVVDARNNLAIRGRSAPLAAVHIHVDAVATMSGGFVMTVPVGDTTVQADREGNFNVLIKPNGVPGLPSLRYDVKLTATLDGRTIEHLLPLRQRDN